MTRPLDIAGSPTLTSLIELIGLELTQRLVDLRGGTDVFLPANIKADSALAKAIGLEPARRIVEHFGGFRHLSIPTGKGIGHNRKINRRRVLEMSEAGASADEIARSMGCTARQIWNILAAARADDPRQPRLF